MSRPRVGEEFRWDLFLRDYRAFLDRQTKTLEETGREIGIHGTVLSSLRTGAYKKIGRTRIEKILKKMGMYYEFYCE